MKVATTALHSYGTGYGMAGLITAALDVFEHYLDNEVLDVETIPCVHFILYT